MRRYTVTVDGTPFTMDIEETAADRFTITIGDRTFEATLEAAEDLPGAVITPGMPVPGSGLLPATGGSPAATVVTGPSPARADVAGTAPARTPPVAGTAPARTPPVAGTAAASRGPLVTAPMPGVVLEVHVTAGAVVHRGDALLVLEAMKMRNTIRSPRDGVVLEVSTEAGRPVVPGEPLVRIGDAPR
jgi:biotin carboxyl carrier protein